MISAFEIRCKTGFQILVSQADGYSPDPYRVKELPFQSIDLIHRANLCQRKAVRQNMRRYQVRITLGLFILHSQCNKIGEKRKVVMGKAMFLHLEKRIKLKKEWISFPA